MRPLRLALIGAPIAHSLSPQIHHQAAAQTGLSVDYALWPLQRAGLAAALPQLRALDGFNVTTPLKEAILPHLDGLSPRARGLGAVNTVYRRGAARWGENTDQGGFERGLPPDLKGHAVVLGAGGAARPVLAALAARGLSLTVLNRRPARGLEALRRLKIEGEARGLDELEALNDASLLVNALPREASLEHVALTRLAPEALVYDLDYRPDAPLLRRAAALGLATQGGLAMLVYQALAAFTLWTGRRPEAGPILETLQTHGVIDSPG